MLVAATLRGGRLLSFLIFRSAGAPPAVSFHGPVCEDRPLVVLVPESGQQTHDAFAFGAVGGVLPAGRREDFVHDGGDGAAPQSDVDAEGGGPPAPLSHDELDDRVPPLAEVEPVAGAAAAEAVELQAGAEGWGIE